MIVMEEIYEDKMSKTDVDDIEKDKPEEKECQKCLVSELKTIDDISTCYTYWADE